MTGEQLRVDDVERGGGDAPALVKCGYCPAAHPPGAVCWERVTVGSIEVGDRLVRDRRLVASIEKHHPQPYRTLVFGDGRRDTFSTNQPLRVWRGAADPWPPMAALTD